MKIYNSVQVKSGASAAAERNTIGKDDFLKILAAQLQNQDPLSTKDNSEYINQMTQFSILEQLQNLNTSTNVMILNQKFQEGNMMLGKTVTVMLTDGTIVSGEVESIMAGIGTVNIVIDGNQYRLDDVVEIQDDRADERIIQKFEELKNGSSEEDVL